MGKAARHLFGLRARQQAASRNWAPNTFYSTGDVVRFAGAKWRATMPVAANHAPQGVGDGSVADRQLLLDQLTTGWGAGTTGGGVSAPTYTVTSAADTNTAGTLRYALNTVTTPLWIIFDKTVFPLANPTAIVMNNDLDSHGNKTIDGRGAGVIFKKFPIKYRSDITSPVPENRGVNTANIIVAYVTFTDYPNGTSVLVFGGNNPWRQGGSDLIYIHHITVWDIEDQNMSNGQHDINMSRSTMDWSKFGPSPGPVMFSLTNLGALKVFAVDSTDVTNDTITTLDSSGNPSNHNVRPNYTFTAFKRENLTTFPFPGSISAGDDYNIRNCPTPGSTPKTVAADSSSNTFTSAGHGFATGDPVVIIGANIPLQLRTGYTYYVRAATTNTFQVSNTSGGGARPFGNNGSGTIQVQKADLTKFQITLSGSGNTWTPLNITSVGTGLYTEDTEPVYYVDGKGPQWGSHHPDDIPDGMQTFTANSATNIITTLYPHLQSDGIRVRFWSQASNLPSGITQGATYYMRDTTSSSYRIAATPGGTAISLGSTAGAEQSIAVTGSVSDSIDAVGHGLSIGEMVTFYGSSLPAPLQQGVVYWLVGGDSSHPAPGADNFYVAQRKGDPILDLTGTGTGTMIKRNPMVQMIIGPNRATIALCDFQHLKIRSPKMICGWYHLFNNRNYKWGDPDKGTAIGGFGNEMADHAQSLIEHSIYTPYSSSGTEVHGWSAFTNPPENVLARGPSIIGIDVDAGSFGPVAPADWTGGSTAYLNANRFEDGATTRNAASGGGVIVSSASLDWYNPSDLVNYPIPYNYSPVPVASDPSTLNQMLDRGAGNVQPWQFIG